MNCIYCHQPLIISSSYTIKDGICRSCIANYLYDHKGIILVCVSYIKDDIKYTFALNGDSNYTSFFKGGIFIKKFPQLYLISPLNIKSWIHKLNTMMVFL